VDPLTGKSRSARGPATAESFEAFDELYAAFERQLTAWSTEDPRSTTTSSACIAKPFPGPVSVGGDLDDCIAKGRDYYDGGPRYNTTYIQCCGIGTVTDSLSAFKPTSSKRAGEHGPCWRRWRPISRGKRRCA
jgi:hypothetical protein